MENKVTVSAKQVTKRFDLAEKQSDKLKAVFKFWGDDVPNFWALKGVSFEAKSGETIGVIGTNGSGKSTLLEMVAGVREPTSGTLDVNGKTSIISVGAGMRPKLTGRANIRLKALLQGMTEKEIDEKMDDIIEFSELGDFIDQPVKSYSSGMKSKLGFAISAYSDSDIVIIDEALSVGDQTFTEKSIERTKRFKEEGKTIFFVAHSSSQMRQVADRILWMHHGNLWMDGPIDVVLPEYERFVKRFQKFSETERASYFLHYKTAQKDFSLKKLEKLAANTRLIMPHTENHNTNNSSKNFQEDDGKMPILTRISLVLITLVTVGLMTKQIMNVSWESLRLGGKTKVEQISKSAKQEPVKKASSVSSEKKSSESILSSNIIQNQYTVQEPMTLSDVSEQTGIPVDTLRAINQFADENLQPGQKVILSSEE